MPDWGSWQGVRELIQNARDAEEEYNAPMEVNHSARSNTLTISNPNVRLPHEALLFGYTTKLNNEKMIGKFGEGLKLGVLALVRSGHPIKIRSGDEIWTPLIEKSEKFNSDVLVFDIRKAKQPVDGVFVKIDGITKEMWSEWKKCFLFLQSEKDLQMKTYWNGSAIFNPDYKGKIYVKGIFVQKDEELNYGYNLSAADVDRDRKLISQYDLSWRLANIWADVANHDTTESGEQVTDLFAMLISEAKDTQEFKSYYTMSNLTSETRTKVKDRFHLAFGQAAVPVTTEDERKMLGHYGKSGVVVPKQLVNIYHNDSNGIGSYLKTLEKEIKDSFIYGSLAPEEQNNLSETLEVLQRVEPEFSPLSVEIVSFLSPDTNGIYSTSTGKIQLSNKLLSDKYELLRVLIHEYAHKAGEDGTKLHGRTIEGIWKKIYILMNEKIRQVDIIQHMLVDEEDE